PRMRDAHWVKPRLVAQVRFTEWTADGKLRHPAFQGLRADKSPEECVREKPAAVSKVAPPPAKTPLQVRAGRPDAPAARPASASAEHSTIRLTNPDRLLYPKDRVTKQDLAAYYQAVAPALLRALKDRPLALVHWNQGIEKEKWFQQDVGKMAEEWMTLAET